ncbi:MAG TPA: bifunctional alpha,alpha-trehalose-phosphate synthase (UDP-forming)/trehalose-phosphatase [Fibrobacteraceae bacterium]|nr:bifunctional alpha,alpha-trehalose-phosphate synthase (UDP-forming)/trehalose-phosphatase [Fibrobacteraceae bacterium]
MNVSALGTHRLVVVSYRLPFHVEDGCLCRNSGGLVSAMLSFANGHSSDQHHFREILWIGVSDDTEESLASARRGQGEEGFRLLPVQLPEELQRQFYEGFSNDLIWPLFHYFASIADYSPANYDAFCEANAIFRDVVVNHLQTDDTLWIHDYHFLLLPKLVRERRPAAEIGFFLHIPFPSFEVFRVMPRSWRRGIISGMLGADLVGLHTYDYVHHFTQTAIRELGAQLQGSWLTTDEGSTRVEAFPIGIDAAAFAADRQTIEAETEKLRIQEAIGNRTLIFSVDRLDYTKGLLHRLQALEQFLELYPEWKNRIVFNMVVVPSRDTIPQYQQMKAEIEAQVGRMNGLMGTLEWRPVAYQYRSLSRTEMIALYDMADIGLITPMRDGMNLVCKEFVASQPPEHPGTLILSEMAGAAAELREAIIINPNDTSEIVEALHRALNTTLEERVINWSRLKDRVFSYDVFAWADDFIESLHNASGTAQGWRGEPLGENAAAEIKATYMTASNRSVLLDYDGTLVPFHRDPEKAVPGAQVHDMLIRLCADSRNRVAIISGRSRDFLERWFGELPVSLVAEHGAFHRLPGEDWVDVWNGERGWKVPFLRAMRRVVRRCPGSSVEEKTTSLVWHYRNAEPMEGFRYALELREDLESIATGEFRIVEGDHIVEIRPDAFDKGKAALRLFGKLGDPFVLAVGDDRTDEDLFSVIPPSGYAIKVGKGNTRARFHLREPAEVLRLLEGLLAAGNQH